MESAREETRAAFPMKAQEEEERQSRLKSKRKEQRRQISTDFTGAREGSGERSAGTPYRKC
jgi:hypothetical protein